MHQTCCPSPYRDYRIVLSLNTTLPKDSINRYITIEDNGNKVVYRNQHLYSSDAILSFLDFLKQLLRYYGVSATIILEEFEGATEEELKKWRLALDGITLP